MPRVHISVNPKGTEIDRPQIRKTAKKILSALGCSDGELSILIVDDEEMARLNREYRQVDATTDVLSFPMRDGEFGNVAPDILGDIVISAPTAQLMSTEHQLPFPAVMDLLLVHGTLHLLGYDHELGDEEARRMDSMTLEILKMLGHPQELFAWYRTAE